MSAWRVAFATNGILLGLFGVFRLLTEVPIGNLVVQALWLIDTVVVHDGILSPAVVGVGWLWPGWCRREQEPSCRRA